MTQQIEPITIFNRENKGVFLRVHTPLFRDDISKAEILDTYGNTLFTSILTATTIEEVAQQLNLKLKTDNTKELLTEIMEADAKDGLYEQETLEEYAEKEYPFAFNGIGNIENDRKNHFIRGAKWQEQRMYSEKEVLQLLLRLQQTESYDNLYDWFEQNKKQ
jgi:hypothetical protein